MVFVKSTLFQRREELLVQPGWQISDCHVMKPWNTDMKSHENSLKMIGVAVTIGLWLAFLISITVVIIIVTTVEIMIMILMI